jgi:bifunctional DNase/RNase
MLKDDETLLELQVYGLVVGPHQPRPMLLMKEKLGGQLLPIALNTLEAQVLAFGSDRPEGPLGSTWELLKALSAQIQKCQFREIRRGRQVLEIYVTGPSSTAGSMTQMIETFAESSMSFALGSKAPIFATQKFIDQCRTTPFEVSMTPEVTPFRGDKIPPGLLQ